jgi:Right handed beta helix region
MMRLRSFFTTLAIAITLWIVMYGTSCGGQSLELANRATEAEREPRGNCPPTRNYFDVKTNLDLTNFNPSQLSEKLIEFAGKLGEPNTTITLGPEVVVDFSSFDFEEHGLYLGRCVILTSVSAFPETNNATNVDGDSLTAATQDTLNSASHINDGRTPRSLGPMIKFGTSRGKPLNFFHIICDSDKLNGDYARISSIRLIGPDTGQQSISTYGIRISRCVGVEISNMEIAGWGGAGIYIVDKGPDQPVGSNLKGLGRIINPEQVKIHDNFFHNNQYPSTTKCDYVVEHSPPPPRVVPKNCVSHAEGYGVNVNEGAWAHIYRNVFDFNRHAIAASGNSGGYRAEQNLILKGGGYHGNILHTYTHIFDIHGTECDGLCGDAGNQFWYIGNAFQFRKDNAIKIRGRPRVKAYIGENVFPHPGLENDWGDDAVNLNTSENVEFLPGNVIDYDSFGKYKVCDFDGDNVDDLFLATGVSWWFSSSGEYHWTYLSAKTDRQEQLRVGYFDDDSLCDVLAEQSGQWVISSGGKGEWQPMGAFGTPLSTVEFGRFDPNSTDIRPGVTRRTTHALRREENGQWSVTPLSTTNWEQVARSELELSQLRFGDFTGDGVTDVLRSLNGRLAISESARGTWSSGSNVPFAGDMASLKIANMDADDNIDDILRLQRQVSNLTVGTAQVQRVTLTWLRSRNGTETWRPWKSYAFQFAKSAETIDPVLGFAGRFRVAAGGGTLVIDPNRLGHFYNEAEIAAGAGPDWASLFPY